ncbi:hypothetical protein [Candidatus Contubernalis alkaliaceticus]|uniref:hypothetical protein n=1 Tax=Candidatus Contubernalis alkaliaceticus TaxID=338645 RepID=UPI001F4C0E6B|nr:hypothetical protein [Candidatus Contubernalis alkalaceticus]UNC93488.1 hypothetical protein HUE98_16235 [Candidatus Contubernalis alkalaceticus]
MTLVILPLLVIIVIGIIIGTFRIPLNKTRPVISLYLVLLLISTAVFYAAAEPGEPVPMPTPEETDNPWEEHDRQINDFYNALFENRIEEYEGAYLNKQWSFDYDQGQLLITTSDNSHPTSMIAVKRKDTEDGRIDIASYTAFPPDPNTTAVSPPEVRLSNNRLEIIPPEPTRVEMVYFFHDFTAAQFTGKGLFMGNRSFFYFSEQPVLYLQIPADLKIETNESTEFYLNYINESSSLP